MDYKKHRSQKPMLTMAELKLRGGQALPGIAHSSRPLVASPWSHEEELFVPRSSASQEIPTGLFEIHGTVIVVVAAIMAFSRIIFSMSKVARQASRVDGAVVKPRHRTLPGKTCLQIQV